jgi:hypothetical protein
MLLNTSHTAHANAAAAGVQHSPPHALLPGPAVVVPVLQREQTLFPMRAKVPVWHGLRCLLGSISWPGLQHLHSAVPVSDTQVTMQLGVALFGAVEQPWGSPAGPRHLLS